MDMMTSLVADRRTVSDEALEAFLTTIAAQDQADAIALVSSAKAELDPIIAAERRGSTRLAQISVELNKQPTQAADDLALALIAGRSLSETKTARQDLQNEQAQLRDAMSSLARQRNGAQKKLELAKSAARQPYAIAVGNLLEEVKATTREHLAGLVACYAAAETLSKTAELRGYAGLIEALRDVIDRAQMRGADLVLPNASGVDAPQDARRAVQALADLGEPLGFQPHTRINRV